jgi:hypothetical protein
LIAFMLYVSIMVLALAEVASVCSKYGCMTSVHTALSKTPALTRPAAKKATYERISSSPSSLAELLVTAFSVKDVCKSWRRWEGGSRRDMVDC